MSEPRRCRAVFFDRDGTLMDDVGHCGDPSKVRVSAAVPELLVRLKRAGYKRVIVTNQSGIGRGLITRAEYEAVQARLLELLGSDAIDATYFCPDTPDSGSFRRKPAPGMVLEAAAEHAIDLSRSYLVGDHPKDILCAEQAGVTSILVGAERGQCAAAFEARDVAEAVEWILAQSQEP